MNFEKPKVPAEQVFEAQWDNYALQTFFHFNKEVAWEVFKDVWNLAIEEAIGVSNSADVARLIIKD